ncbi:MAG: hypothetical protein FWH18_09890 [Marinilabiliaceae bacterium]|nr:hypothetical protein [Marinilabiliaceae bacterium]
MKTVVVQIKNERAFRLLENLEALNVIKLLERIPYSQSVREIGKISDRSARLSEIRSITKDIHVDLTNFHFNRDEANNFDN